MGDIRHFGYIVMRVVSTAHEKSSLTHSFNFNLNFNFNFDQLQLIGLMMGEDEDDAAFDLSAVVAAVAAEVNSANDF